MPGVLVVEALAQVGAVLALREIEDRDQKLVLFTGIKEARFRRPVVPGDTLILEVTAMRIGSRVQRMRGEAKVEGQLAADADIMSIVADRDSALIKQRGTGEKGKGKQCSFNTSFANLHFLRFFFSRSPFPPFPFFPIP